METLVSVSTQTASDDGCENAQQAMVGAARNMPRTTELRATGGGLRATFRPSAKPQSASPGEKPQSAVAPAPERRPITEGSIKPMLHGKVARYLQKTEDREAALEKAKNWLSDLLSKSDLSDDDRAARQSQIATLDVVTFWAEHRFPPKSSRPSQPAPEDEPSKVEASHEGAKAKTPPPAAQPADLLCLMGGVNQVGFEEDDFQVENEQDEKPTAMPMTDPTSSSQPASAKPKAGVAPRPRLLHKPLNAPGHLQALIERFTQRNVEEKGMDHETALKKAVGKAWHLVENAKGLSDKERSELIALAKTFLPKRELKPDWSRPKPPPLTPERIGVLLDRFVEEGLSRGYDSESAAAKASLRVVGIIHHHGEVAEADRGRLLDKVKNYLQTFFTKPIREAGGTCDVEEIERANDLVQDCFNQAMKPHLPRPPKRPRRSGPPRPVVEPIQVERELHTLQPKIVWKPNLSEQISGLKQSLENDRKLLEAAKAFLLEEVAVGEAELEAGRRYQDGLLKLEELRDQFRTEQADRAKTKKAERQAKAEASAKASQTLPRSMMETPGESKRRHREKMASKAKKAKGKDKGKGGKK